MGYGRGSVTRVRTRGGPRYRVRIPDGRGGYISAGTYASREEAERMRDACLDERDAGGSLAQTVEQYGQRVLDRWELSGKRSITSDRGRWRQLVSRAPWIDAPVDAVTRAAVRDWCRGLVRAEGRRSDGAGGTVSTGRPVSHQTIKHALGLVRRVFAEAVEDGLLTENPALDVKPPPVSEPAGEGTYLSVDEIEALFALELPAEQRAVLSVAIFAGLRLGELAGLRWEDVRLGDYPHLLVRRSWDGAPKTRSSTRPVDLIPRAHAELRAWWEHQGRPDMGLVWPSPSGRVYSRGYDWGWEGKVTERVCYLGLRRRAGILRHVRFHDLRHTCASHLVMGTWGYAWRLEWVQRLLGHTSVTVTERYGHLDPSRTRAAAAATKPDADLTPPVSPPPAKYPESLAGGEEFESPSFGSGGPRQPPESLSFSPCSQVADRFAADLLERAARGDTIPDELITALASSVVSSEPVRLALQLAAGDSGDPHRLRQALRLARAVSAVPDIPDKNDMAPSYTP